MSDHLRVILKSREKKILLVETRCCVQSSGLCGLNWLIINVLTALFK